jgi:hypothetical protein
VTIADDRWHASEIPDHKRKHMYVDGEGFLTLHLKPSVWIKAGDARARIAQALSVDAETAATALHSRLVSGHVVASAGDVFGRIATRERIKITGGRDLIPNDHWQWLKLADPLWLIGDLQIRVVGEGVASLRSVTYTDTRFLEANVLEMISAAEPNQDDQPSVREPLSAATTLENSPLPRKRGRPRGSGTFDVEDAVLLKEMVRLLNSREARSPHAASLIVAERAAGGGTLTSRTTRLRDKYLKQHGDAG